MEENMFSREQNLLLWLSRTDFEKHIPEKVFDDINWIEFKELALHHRLFSLIYPRLKKFKEQLIPSYIKEELGRLYKSNTMKMMQLSGEMGLISKVLLNGGIHTLFLKGPVLAEELYGSLSLRTSRDLDFLVPLDKLEDAEQLLVSLGYVKNDYFPKFLNEWKWRHHHLAFYHPEKHITAEVHWRLSPGPGKEPQFKELWERKRKSAITHQPVYFLGKEDLFYFLVTHGARHGWSRLRWLADIDRLVVTNPDWRVAYHLLKRFQCLQLGAQSLLLASQLFQTEIPGAFKEITAGKKAKKLAENTYFYLKEKVNLHTEPLPEHVSNYHSHYLYSLKSFEQKILFLLNFLYPYPSDQDKLPLPKTFHFLYFPLRPFLLLWNRVNKKVLI
ncbi:nucleotidyltransferase family protein [Metabacillus sp. GX 13764]|uniref:nucleotidyltransferase domain-containing protein n=1 Tax=Metabacillus kandeliae TaxID=2900151 RepID=UPI001E51975A|nr:nucleotidyltransferase family protein [Metabacillus kandeliae]MCD7033164.1 nucleotidyltransferase family protein [Metabacillus kandeliae]